MAQLNLDKAKCFRENLDISDLRNYYKRHSLVSRQSINGKVQTLIYWHKRGVLVHNPTIIITRYRYHGPILVDSITTLSLNMSFKKLTRSQRLTIIIAISVSFFVAELSSRHSPGTL